ncbi:cytochrome P450 [Dactylosporangium sp. NPDC000555]|uniref:cytochrome P450 n=1 Tax=Dactylosporangium sp. NPDC000555 TaxID=3154260 RepID=UPI0033346831
MTAPTLPDLFTWLERSRRDGEVHFDERQRAWTVLGHPEVSAVLGDPHTFSSDLGDLQPRQEDLDLFRRGNFVQMDPPRHDSLRRLVSRAFTPRVVSGLAPRITAVTAELLDEQAGEERFDLVDDLAYPLPVIVIAELLGIPAADRPVFRRWADALFERPEIGPDQPLTRLTDDRAVNAVAPVLHEMNAYLLEHVRAHRETPADNLTGNLVRAEADGERLSDEEIIGFVGLLLLAGHITTTATLGNTIVALDEHPDAAAELRADPALLPDAIEEVLRLRTPFPRLARLATTDATIGGQPVAAGDLVVAWLAAANRDSRVFAEPERFDIRRNPNPHLTFGHGIHFCIGAPLARLEARIAMELLLRRYREIAVDTAATVHRNPWVMLSPTKLPVTVVPA